MQNFKMNKVALAVGATLLVSAGIANAVVGAPAQRAANAALLNTAATDAQIRSLMSANGLSAVAMTVDVTLNSGAVAPLTSTAANALGSAVVTFANTSGVGVGMIATVPAGTVGWPAGVVTVASLNATTVTLSAVSTAAIPLGTVITFTPAAANGLIATDGGLIEAYAAGTPPVTLFPAGLALTVGNATPANNNVIVWSGATNAATVPVISAALGAPVSGTSHITITLAAPVAPAAYRINGATGGLEYTSNNGTTGGTAVAFAAVKVDVQNSALAGSPVLYTEMDGVAGYATPAVSAQTTSDTLMAAQAGIVVGNSLAPVPTIATTSAAGGALINGFKINTGASIALVAANVAVKTAAPGASGYIAGVAFPTAAVSAPVCTAATATAAANCTITFPALGTTATAAPFVSGAATATAADAAAYASTYFNTGVTGAAVPFSVDGVLASKASYTNVFNVSDGVASKLSNAGGAVAGDAASFALIATTPITDGASPVVTTAAVTDASIPATASSAAAGTTTLSLTFSEPMTTMGTIGGSDDLREIAENVTVGLNSLAALNLNLGGTLGVTLPAGTLNDAVARPISATTAGTTTLNITGVDASSIIVQPTSAAAATFPNTIAVSTGIAFKEANDTGYVLGTNALDNTASFVVIADTKGALASNFLQLAGGIKSATGVVEAASTAAALTASLNSTIVFNGNYATASAQTSLTDTSKIASIAVTFNAGKKVMLNPTGTPATNAQLLSDLVINISGVAAGGAPLAFNVQPSAVAVSATGDLTITLPTALIYSKLNSVSGMTVSYLNNAGATQPGAVADVLTAFGTQAASTTPIKVAPGQIGVSVPLSATLVNNQLYTQSVTGTVADAAQGSIVNAYLARYDSSATTQIVVTASDIGTGFLSQLADVGLSNNIVIQYAPGEIAALASLITNSINGTKGFALNSVIPLYVDYTRSNSGAGQVGGTGSSTSVQAVATVSTTPVNVTGTGTYYQLMLNPLTGAITGPLVGTLQINKNSVNQFNSVGISFINPANGAKTAVPSLVGSTQVSSTGVYNLTLGVDAGNGAKAYQGAFTLLVLQQPDGTFKMLTSADTGSANYLPFAPSILSAAAGATRTVAPLVTVANIKSAPAATTASWALYPLGNMARAAAAAGNITNASFPGMLTGLSAFGTPISLWNANAVASNSAVNGTVGNVGNAAQGPAALAMAGGVMAVDVKLPNGDTTGTITQASMVAGSAALAVSTANITPGTVQVLTLPTVAAVTAPAGWSLVTVPAGGWTAANAPAAIIKVGSQITTGSYSWFTGDVAAPAVTAGEAVFVYKTVAGVL